jgi:hypothetical protein
LLSHRRANEALLLLLLEEGERGCVVPCLPCLLALPRDLEHLGKLG